MTEPLNGPERTDALADLAGWREVEGRDAIRKEFNFATFIEAFGFMSRAAMKAEEMNHQPEWTNVYTSVDVTLTTHDAGGVTAKDIALAAEMDRLAVQTA